MRKVYTDDTKHEAISMLAEGKPLDTVSDILGVNKNTLRRWVNEGKVAQPEPDIETLLQEALSIIARDKEGKSRSLETGIEQKLDRIFELQGTENELAKDIDQMIEKLTAQRVKLVESVVEERKRLEAEVKADVVEKGETVAGRYLQAVYSAGTRSCDFEGLENFGKTHPDVLNFISKSKPHVSIKAVKVAKGKK